jgi:ABC-type bacteriocin/lantibiotic exporter with double-glycine peptidase domain
VIERDVLSQKVAVLFADDEIFSGTLFDNLTIGNQNISQQEIDKACEIVGLSDFVNSQQIGYNAYLDTQGKKLSYNIIQKILLARCILIKPAILLIEDGWQGIETKIREQIIKYLTNKNNSFTLITITNDEFFASQCERKINMENGGLVDFK